jgi:outer membrane protein assembly factor BamD (BamD/ComL family)
MGLFQALVSKWSEAKARRLYQQAVERERNGDIEGAILSCTAIIHLRNMPAEWRAKALLHRAAAHWKQGDVRQSFEDLEVILEMPDVSDDLKKLARQSKHSYLGR